MLEYNVDLNIFLSFGMVNYSIYFRCDSNPQTQISCLENIYGSSVLLLQCDSKAPRHNLLECPEGMNIGQPVHYGILRLSHQLHFQLANQLQELTTLVTLKSSISDIPGTTILANTMIVLEKRMSKLDKLERKWYSEYANPRYNNTEFFSTLELF